MKNLKSLINKKYFLIIFLYVLIIPLVNSSLVKVVGSGGCDWLYMRDIICEDMINGNIGVEGDLTPKNCASCNWSTSMIEP